MVSLEQAREGFAEDLWLYGEDELAGAMLDTDDATYGQVMIAAGDPKILDIDPRQSWSVEEMAALGAVQVLTGEVRYCKRKRKRKRPRSSLQDFWDLVGHDRDRRGPDQGMGRLLG